MKDTRPSGGDRCDRRPATRGFTPSCVSREHGRSQEEAGRSHFREAEAAHRSPASWQNGRVQNSAPCATTAHAQVFHVKHRLGRFFEARWTGARRQVASTLARLPWARAIQNGRDGLRPCMSFPIRHTTTAQAGCSSSDAEAVETVGIAEPPATRDAVRLWARFSPGTHRSCRGHGTPSGRHLAREQSAGCAQRSVGTVRCSGRARVTPRIGRQQSHTCSASPGQAVGVVACRNDPGCFT